MLSRDPECHNRRCCPGNRDQSPTLRTSSITSLAVNFGRPATEQATIPHDREAKSSIGQTKITVCAHYIRL